MSTPWPPERRWTGLAVDLGSARTRVWALGGGMVLDVPTVTFPDAGPDRGPRTLHPFRRHAVDVAGTARMLDRLLRHGPPRLGRPLVVLTTPVLDGVPCRAAARAAVEVLRPRAVLTVPTARAVALAAREDLSRPLLVVDAGARFTETVLLVDGVVTDAQRVALGACGLDDDPASARLVDAVAAMVATVVDGDRTTAEPPAAARGVLLAGGGAVRPGFVRRLARLLDVPVKVVPAPDTAAVRGAAELLGSARRHPSSTGDVPAPVPE
ncbi:rod shape-determining protein [Actinacidiphila glaucinigra]|uniref:Rod shape-determining protein MreB n=1 Tax=Actinacidiphila glaucinigra TaxID=235986 RepID=A0A239DY55_9ACTN|nr:rod shape-determining protein [Actinacidiphila glaucinigra]SNS37277.1 rod shape-determining protein MreB [Actinacidiphila glaucinigra]